MAYFNIVCVFIIFFLKSTTQQDGRQSACFVPSPSHNLCQQRTDLALEPFTVYVSCGKLLQRSLTQSEPAAVKFYGAVDVDKYVLIMVDPDAPTPENPTKRYIVHWLITDIQGWVIKNGLTVGNTVVHYHSPHPPAGSSPHRYQFYLFKQIEFHMDTTGVSDANRLNFDLNAFLTKNNLCELVAVFEYKTQY